MALILVGKSASGKDTIRTELVKLGMQRVVSYTTRPKRPNEVDGVDYHFVSLDEFNKQNLFGVRKYTVAGGDTWYYGFQLGELSANSVLILDPIGLRDLKDVKDVSIVSFYIKVATDIRKQRALNRGDKINEVERRMKADEHDFFFIEPRVDFSINYSQGKDKIVAQCIYDLYQNYIGGASV